MSMRSLFIILICFTKKTVSEATFLVIARLDRAIQETLKTLDSRLRKNDGTGGVTYGSLNNSPDNNCVIKYRQNRLSKRRTL